MTHEHPPDCPTVRLIFTALTRHFGDVTVTIDAYEQRLELQTQNVLSLLVEYKTKAIPFSAKALHDIGAISMMSWSLREEFSTRMGHPALVLMASCPVLLPNGKRATRHVESIISQDRLRSIRLEIPRSENSSQRKSMEYC